MSYPPIEHHGIIGDMHTIALVTMDGCIDWLCLPHFDSGSVFAAILDHAKGGHFSLAPSDSEAAHRQSYWPDTNVLITRFLCPGGVGEVVDYMPVGLSAKATGRHQVVRQVRVVRGSMRFHLECFPAFSYARDGHETTLTNWGAVFKSGKATLGLRSDHALAAHPLGVVANFTMQEGETAAFVLGWVEPGASGEALLSEQQAIDLLTHTVQYWRHWLAQCNYRGRWRETVHRSALVLKLLTFEPTGAIVAAPTCSLPEAIGGVRNWDYRYTWIRDAAFTLYALLRIGFTQEAAHFMQWLEARCHELEPDGSLQVMYGLDGRHRLDESVLEHLEGYRGSAPVRIGNAAYNQLQLDISGELMDSVYLYDKYGSPISYDLWRYLRRLINWTADNWQRPDEGIWEVRAGRQHFVYSKLMCWVALDRGLRLADKRSFPAERHYWMGVRDQIYEQIMSKGWNEHRRSFVQHYDGQTLDASTLMMPLVFFLSPSDPRGLKTIEAICQPPTRGGLLSNSLVYRYNVDDSPDGLHGDEGTFNMCTFWLVEALTRAGWSDPARLDAARLLFEQMLGYANHLGLYAEETGPRGEMLGNFPQAFTHIALISAAVNLDRALGDRD